MREYLRSTGAEGGRIMAHAHPEAVALYRAILAHPDDDTPRLVYADWLDENGGANERTRAAFIRTQCQLARMDPCDEGYTAIRLRADRLRRELGETWWHLPGEEPNAIALHRTKGEPVRGFPGAVKLSPAVTPEEGAEWVASRPITEAQFSFYHLAGAGFWRLTTETLPALRALTLDMADHCPLDVRRDVCQTLAAAEVRGGLTRLTILGDPTPEGLAAVVSSPHLRNLEALTVRGWGIGDEHAGVLAARTNLPALRELSLGHTSPSAMERVDAAVRRGLTPAGAARLAGAAWFPRLHALRLFGHNELGEDGLGVLGARPLPELRTLAVCNCGHAGAVLRFAGSPNAPAVADVTVTRGVPNGNDVRALAVGPQRFQSLELSFDGPFDMAADTVRAFEQPTFGELRRLSLYKPGDAWTGLTVSPVVRSVRVLEVRGAQTDPVPLLLAGAEWPCLERLVLGRLSGESLFALIASEKFPRLVSLQSTCDNRTVTAFLRKLAKCPAAAKLRELDLHARLTPTTARALADSPYLSEIERFTVRRGSTSPGDRDRLREKYGARMPLSG